MSGFNLVASSWVPMLTRDGNELVTLAESLIRAEQYQGLALDSPLETVALFRQVILPVYLDAVFQEPGVPLPASATDWTELWTAGHLDVWPSWAGRAAGEPGPITSYLERYRDRFEVFGNRPFAQVGDLHTAKGETKPISLLIAHLSTGNNVPLFTARTEADPPVLKPDEAIRAVLAAHCWDTAGIKSGAVGDPRVKSGKTTGNHIGPVGAIGMIMPVGRTFAETLLLHVLSETQGSPDDRPQWRAPRATAAWSSVPPVGQLDLLTWQARRIRLIPEETPDGIVVRNVVISAGDRLPDGVPQVEPHTAWRESRQTQRQVPVRHTAGQAAWRGMLPMLAVNSGDEGGNTSSLLLRHIAELQYEGALPSTYPLRVLCAGMTYGTQNAIVEDTVVDMLPLPLAALSDGEVRALVGEVVEQAEALRNAVNRLGDELRAARGGDRIPWDKGDRPGDRMMHVLNGPARIALAALQAAPDDADNIRRRWLASARRAAWETAQPLLDTAPPATFLGRVSKGQRPQRASSAELWFRVELSKILGPAEQSSPPEGPAV